MKIKKSTLQRIIHEESCKKLYERYEGSDINSVDSSDLIAFADVWSSLGANVQEQVKDILINVNSADVNPHAIRLASERLQGFNAEIDDTFHQFFDDSEQLGESTFLEDKINKGVTLKGPFKPVNIEPDTDVYEGQLWVTINNDEFNSHLLRKMGITDPDEIEDYKSNPPSEHTFHVVADFHWSPAEPEVGHKGGITLEGWELLALDGMELTLEDDDLIRGHIESAVRENQAEWIAELEASRDESQYGFDY